LFINNLALQKGKEEKMGNRAGVDKIGKTIFKYVKNEKGRKERAYLFKDGEWYKKSDFPYLKPEYFADSGWLEIFPEGTLLSDDYGSIYEIREQKLLKIGFCNEEGKKYYFEEPEGIV